MSLMKITVIKKFTYRGDANEEWSNSYILKGTTPANQAAWEALADKLALVEKQVVPSNVTYVRAYFYNDINANSTGSYLYPGGVVGTLVTTGGFAVPGDAAVWGRADTGRINSQGKKIYVRKYWHGAYATTGTPDLTLAAQKAKCKDVFDALLDPAVLPGGQTVTDKEGSTLSNTLGCTYVTTRTLKRRGKRPGS